MENITSYSKFWDELGNLTMGEKLALCQKECDSYNQARTSKPLNQCPLCHGKGRLLRPVYERLYSDYVSMLFPCECVQPGAYRPAAADVPEEFINESLFGV
jgi:hypothetical protein